MDSAPQTGEVILRDGPGGGWLRFGPPLRVIQAYSLDDVLPALQAVEAAVTGEGLSAAGFLSYEAGPAFDPALSAHAPADFPLLWFGLSAGPPQPCSLPAAGPESFELDWRPNTAWESYDAAIQQVKAEIARGATYQVNYTLRLRAAFAGEPWAYFLWLMQAQPATYAGYVDIGRFAILSASPELFFSLDGQTLTACPMKGTAGRGLTLAGDRAQADWLRTSDKNRAENVMIVDMLRNDLGRVAETGSVQVPDLFAVQRLPAVWQMTSTVTARSKAPFGAILKALFPCASITGAPKASTMRIIRRLEPEPRRIYTGCLGYLTPGRRAQFNVAIRTVLLDKAAGQAEYGVGGGVVWDSTSDDEYAECLLKARLLHSQPPQFDLLETLRWEPGQGYWLLDEHLARLAESGEYFGRLYDEAAVRKALAELAAGPPPQAYKVRLRLPPDGQPVLEAQPLPPPLDRPLRLALAPQPVESSSPFLYHKTTWRQVYQAAQQARPLADDVILWNERGELTETCTSNLALRMGDEWITPPVACGLLPGIYRASLLTEGRLREDVLLPSALAACQAIAVFNSVRGWRQAVYVGE